MSNKADVKLSNLGAAPRPNLLDNWYFVGGGSQQGGGQFPINQRGETSYDNTAGSAFMYGIDRWFNGAIALTPQGLKMSSATILYQRHENTEIFTGETLTYSVLWSDGKLLTTTGTPDQIQGANDGDRAIGFAIDSSLSILWVSIQSLDATEKTAVAAKLELGPTQTLAYQDEDGNWQLFETPNYGEELAKCQRYFYKWDGAYYFASGNGGYPVLEINFPVTMRINPTISQATTNTGKVPGENSNKSGVQFFADTEGTLCALMKFTASAEL